MRSWPIQHKTIKFCCASCKQPSSSWVSLTKADHCSMGMRIYLKWQQHLEVIALHSTAGSILACGTAIPVHAWLQLPDSRQGCLELSHQLFVPVNRITAQPGHFWGVSTKAFWKECHACHCGAYKEEVKVADSCMRVICMIVACYLNRQLWKLAVLCA